MADKPTSVDEYIASFPEDVAEILEGVRRVVLEVAPGAGEKISYQMPTMTLDGRSLVHFAAWKHHISMYPMPSMDPVSAADFAPYAGDKGTVRFPLAEPMPYDLVRRLVEGLVRQHQ